MTRPPILGCRLALLLLSPLLFALPSVSFGQEPTRVLAPFAPSAPMTVLSAGFQADAQDLTPSLASTPLRLSLLSGVYPLGPAFGGAGCEPAASVDDAGTIFPVQPYAFLALTPRLVLHGFSDLGCPGHRMSALDAGAGGGLTYGTSLAPDLWLVAGAGAFGIPGRALSGVPLGIPPRLVTEMRLDVVHTLPDKRSVRAGIGLQGVRASGPSRRIVPSLGATF